MGSPEALRWLDIATLPCYLSAPFIGVSSGLSTPYHLCSAIRAKVPHLQDILRAQLITREKHSLLDIFKDLQCTRARSPITQSVIMVQALLKSLIVAINIISFHVSFQAPNPTPDAEEVKRYKERKETRDAMTPVVWIVVPLLKVRIPCCLFRITVTYQSE